MIEYEVNQHVQALAYQIQKEGNSYNGDSFFIKASENYFICAVADGLGSGWHAYASSSAICKVVEQSHYEEVDVLIEACNQALKGKRGATVSILKVDFLQKKFTYSSVGNIKFMLYSPQNQFIYPLPVMGYLSGKPQKYRVETFTYEKDSKFIIHTDGLNSPAIKQLLSSFKSIEDISADLKMYTKTRKDDLTYIVGHLY